MIYELLLLWALLLYPFMRLVYDASKAPKAKSLLLQPVLQQLGANHLGGHHSRLYSLCVLEGKALISAQG